MSEHTNHKSQPKVAIIGTVGLPSNYGGFETLTENLTGNLGQQYKFTVFCSNQNISEKKSYHNNAKLKYLPFNANGIQSIPYDITSMLISLRQFDIVLILGVSGCIALPLIKIFSKEKIIVNIDGVEWRRDKWNRFARWFLKISEKIAVKYSDVVITDNKVVQKYVLQEYGRESTLIEYGGSHVEKVAISQATYDDLPYLINKYAFSVCRIEPENNIRLILDSFSSTGFPLVIVGNWKNSTYASSLKSTYEQYHNIHLLDPIYDQRDLNELRSNAYIYIHGHSAGGTNPSLVEAMCLGLPVLAYSVNFNEETTENAALYFSNSEELSCLIRTIENNRLLQISRTMADIAKRRYQWNVIADQYGALFE